MERFGRVEEDYLSGALRDRPATFLLARGVVGLVAAETNRPDGSPVPLCPPLGVGGVDGAFLRSVFAVGRAPELPTGEDAPPAPERLEAADLLHVVGVAPATTGTAQAHVAPPVVPPAVRGEAAWRAGLDAMSVRLSGMPEFWAVLLEVAPANRDDVVEAFARLRLLGDVDAGDRLDLLHAMGAVRVDDAGRYWLTSRGASCADAWARREESKVPSEGSVPSADGGLAPEEVSQLNDVLLGL